jgi:branched-chain amino acid transport system ATP-binding protein
MSTDLITNEPEGEPDVLLSVEDVGIYFGGVHALSSVSVKVRKGQITGLIGPNGAGKTSLLNCINGVYRANSGRIIFENRNIVGVSPHRVARMGIGRTFQGVEVLADGTVMQNVLLGREILMRSGILSGIFRLPFSTRDEARHRAAVEDVLESFDLHVLRKRKVGDLPYGLQKLVSIARAVAMEPTILLLDEPTSGMTAHEKREIATVLADLSASRGLTQVIIEHDVQLIRDLCDYIYVLDFGHVIAEGRPEEVLARSEVVEAYLGKALETA